MSTTTRPVCGPTERSAFLDAVIAAVTASLASQPDVDGLLVTGSTATGRADETSDLDLVAVVGPDLGAVAQIATELDGIAVDFVVVPMSEIEALADESWLAPYWSGGGLPRMLNEGRILLDRTGVLARAKAVCSDMLPREPAETDIENARFGALYDLDHVKRLLASRDPRRRLAGEVRLAHSVSVALPLYFVTRRLAWRGHGKAIDTLSRSDPGFLTALAHCLAAPDGTTRCARYELVVRHALFADTPAANVPAGPLIRFRPEATPASAAEAAGRWTQIIGRTA